MVTLVDGHPLTRAFAALRCVEDDLSVPRRRSAYGVTARAALRHDASDELDLSRLTDPSIRAAIKRPGSPHDAVSGCAALSIGKFSRSGQLKARGYLKYAGGPATVKVWVTAAGATELGTREQEARVIVGTIPAYRAPEVLTVGTADGVDYLVERAVYGRLVISLEDRLRAVSDLAPSLARAYAEHGLERRRLSEVTHRQLPDRMRAVLSELPIGWDPSWGSRVEIERRVSALIAGDRYLTCSFGHGDLVLTNIIRTAEDTHVLTDWEHAGFMPAAFDLAKLLFMTGEPTRATTDVAPTLRALLGADGDAYSWEEQLALGVCQFLSGLPQRLERAREVGREEVLLRQTAERLEWLSHLLAG